MAVLELENVSAEDPKPVTGMLRLFECGFDFGPVNQAECVDT